MTAVREQVPHAPRPIVTHGRVAHAQRDPAPAPQELAGRPAWHALRLRSRFEFAVRDALAAQNIEQFLPVYTTETRWTDRQALTTRPLFAGYIFARFDPAHACQVLSTRGVVDILGANHKPEAIPDAQIESLRRVTERAPGRPCSIAPGDTITVARGPFAGTRGVVTRVKGVSTLTVPVEILGRAVSVQIEASDVEPAEKVDK